MTMRKFLTAGIMIFFLIGFLFQPVLAFHLAGDDPLDPAGYPRFDPQWKEKQDALFEKYGLEDGKVYNSTNCETIKPLLPEPVYNWVKRGEWEIPVKALKYDMGTAWAKLRKYDVLNKGKYTLGDRTQIIEKATGTYPQDMTGTTFPVEDIDFSNPETAAVKIMHNTFTFTDAAGALIRDLIQEWVGLEGSQKYIFGTLTILSYLDINNGLPNPNEFKATQLINFSEPYDVKGTGLLNWRYLDGSPDKGFIYIPVIRRVKRVNAANRSTPSMGSDFCNDDQNCFWGTVESMKWKMVGETDFLLPIPRKNADKIQAATQLPDGSWDADKNVEQAKFGYDFPDWKGSPWAMKTVAWIPKSGWILEMFPRDEYYTYGRQQLYITKRNMVPQFKIVYNRAGEYWKTIMAVYNCYTRGPHSIGYATDNYLAVDEKTHHATIAVSAGKFKGKEFRGLYLVPWIKPGMFAPNYLTQMNR